LKSVPVRKAEGSKESLSVNSRVGRDDNAGLLIGCLSHLIKTRGRQARRHRARGMEATLEASL
jgi:hypothetical protein